MKQFGEKRKHANQLANVHEYEQLNERVNCSMLQQEKQYCAMCNWLPI